MLLSQAPRWLVLAGVIGPILYVGVFTLAGFLRPGYSPIRQSISTLGVGIYAWLLNTTTVILGVLLLAFSIGFFLSMQRVIKKKWLVACLVLLLLSNVGVINTGIFTAAPGTVLLHWTLGFLLGLLPLVVVYAISGWQWRRVDGWLPPVKDDQRASKLAAQVGIEVITISTFSLEQLPRGGPLFGYARIDEEAIPHKVKTLAAVLEQL